MSIVCEYIPVQMKMPQLDENIQFELAFRYENFSNKSVRFGKEQLL
jgi:hypothetical protein